MKSPALQDMVHQVVEGGGTRFFRIGFAVLAVLLLLVGYNWRAYHNLNNQEAMDAAQVARNLSEGKGFTTLCVRPFSIFLLSEHARKVSGASAQAPSTDAARLKGDHPDLANPPLYPVVLAGLMKVLPFRFTLPAEPRKFWSPGGTFVRYEPDFLLALFNQLLFLATVVLVFFLARRLFDPTVAWTSALLLLGSELFWRFSVSGLSTVLLLFLFVGLAWCVALWEEETRNPRWGEAGVLGLAAAAGLLVGLGGLTRYGFLGLLLPLLAFFLVFGGSKRVVVTLVALFACAVVITPWIVRNVSLSGVPFGTATYALVEDTGAFPDHRLERSLEPNLAMNVALVAGHKLLANAQQVVLNDLPRLGGTWLTAFFLVGLLVALPNEGSRRLRYFLAASLVVLALTQALGRTQLSDDSPEVNSENLLVLLAPFVLVYGVSLFYLLLSRIALPGPEFRPWAIGLFGVVACLPLFLALLSPRAGASNALPVYSPPHIQNLAGYLKENELVMSDVPWAVAWYGQRQSVWLTLNAQSDFFAINDSSKPVAALYLTPKTTDSRFFSQWVAGPEKSWGSLVVNLLARAEAPANFPLRSIPALPSNPQMKWLSVDLVLLDWDRWRSTPGR